MSHRRFLAAAVGLAALLCGTVHAEGPAPAAAPASAPEPEPTKLQVRSWAAACANCHGTAGIALGEMKSLAGVKAEDLLHKLQDFKSGRKPATLMHQLSKGYSDVQLQALAAYFAALPPQAATPASSAK